MEHTKALEDALWRIYRRKARPTAWENGGNLPWNDPEFSARMLREHLDQSHSAASRTDRERAHQLDWLWSRLALQPGSRVLDLTCGPGLYATALAERGCIVTGVDFSPASVAHARELAARIGVSDRCTFIECDVRTVQVEPAAYDAVLFLYGQLAVFTRQDAAYLLGLASASLVTGGRLCIELLEQDRVDKRNSTWWFTDDTGLWGDGPYINLGERIWDADAALSIERFLTLHLESGKLDEVVLCDQSYAVAEMRAMLAAAGFDPIDVYLEWDKLPLNDAAEWNVYIGRKRSVD